MAKPDGDRFQKESATYQAPDRQNNRKRNKTGYNIFFSQHVLKLKSDQGDGVPTERGSVARVVGDAWKKMTAEEKDEFELKADKQNEMDPIEQHHQMPEMVIQAPMPQPMMMEHQQHHEHMVHHPPPPPMGDMNDGALGPPPPVDPMDPNLMHPPPHMGGPGMPPPMYPPDGYPGGGYPGGPPVIHHPPGYDPTGYYGGLPPPFDPYAYPPPQYPPQGIPGMPPGMPPPPGAEGMPYGLPPPNYQGHPPPPYVLDGST